jgi:hypothetical protein
MDASPESNETPAANCPPRPAQAASRRRESTPKIRPLINEQRGSVFAEQLISYIGKNQGHYLRDETGNYHVILDGHRIALIDTPDNHLLADLMIKACSVSTLSPAARAAIQRLQVTAAKKAEKMQLRRFSALSSDGARLYVPLDDGQLLQITADGLKCCTNGENQDGFWVEHPSDDPLKYSLADPVSDLALFERLLVDTQACTVPSMRWLVAMNAGLFPFVRRSSPARFLLEIIGPSQKGGKTSGSRRYSLLQGLGDVKGDFSVPALANLGDIGLLILDNKEQANFSQELIDFFLFLATGAERGRCYADGRLRPSDAGRPVGIITTIEGVAKAELRARCVQVQYLVKGDPISRGPIEQEISQRRHEIGSALMHVLVRYLHIQRENRPTPNPIPNFEEHFTTLADLLRAFGEVAGKPPHWSEDLISNWSTTLSSAKEDEDELEHPILRVLKECVSIFPDTKLVDESFTYEGVAGKLYVTEATDLLTFLQKLNLRDLNFPKTAQGLSRRLNACKFQALVFLPADSAGVPSVKRTSRRKPIGFFRPDMTP